MVPTLDNMYLTRTVHLGPSAVLSGYDTLDVTLFSRRAALVPRLPSGPSNESDQKARLWPRSP